MPAITPKLSEPEVVALAVAQHQKNVSNCMIGLGSCDPSGLTPFEAREWNVVQHRRNLVDCQNGSDACDRSKLTPLEIRDIDIASNHRNLADCKTGWTCNHSSLTSTETTEVNVLEHQRNAENCENGWGECAHSKLTVSETRETALRSTSATFQRVRMARKAATIQSLRLRKARCFRMLSTSATTALA